MKLEKRSSDASPVSKSAASPRSRKGRSHILIYILILFIAAFLLMTLSFLSHQRSNEQVMGQLNTNVSSLKKLQTALEENMRLQEQLSAYMLEIETLENQLENAKTAESQLKEELSVLDQTAAQQKAELEALNAVLSSMNALSSLQQHFLAGELDICRALIADMESAGWATALPQAEFPASLQIFQQIKDLTAISADG